MNQAHQTVLASLRGWEDGEMRGMKATGIAWIISEEKKRNTVVILGVGIIEEEGSRAGCAAEFDGRSAMFRQRQI